MKLRIRGNSVRLRLAVGEVQELAETGRIEDRLVFGPSDQLVYAVEAHRDDDIALVRGPGEIAVRLPAEDIAKWADSDQVGFETMADNGEGGVRILVEKDFSCLTPREGEEDSDTYPNPASQERGSPAGAAHR
jgi:hypothetical protein